MPNQEKQSMGENAKDSTETLLPESLADRIGFVDTAEMQELKRQILLVAVEVPEFGDLYGRYQEAGEILADQAPGPEGRIALMLKSAEIIAKLGLIDDAMEAYGDAMYCAQQEGLQELADKISMTIEVMGKLVDEIQRQTEGTEK